MAAVLQEDGSSVMVNELPSPEVNVMEILFPSEVELVHSYPRGIYCGMATSKLACMAATWIERFGMDLLTRKIMALTTMMKAK